jgi:hypothetical protein
MDGWVLGENVSLVCMGGGRLPIHTPGFVSVCLCVCVCVCVFSGSWQRGSCLSGVSAPLLLSTESLRYQRVDAIQRMHHSRVRHVDESVHPDPMDHVHLITAMYRHLQRQLDGGPYHSLLGGVQHLPLCWKGTIGGRGSKFYIAPPNTTFPFTAMRIPPQQTNRYSGSGGIRSPCGLSTLSLPLHGHQWYTIRKTIGVSCLCTPATPLSPGSSWA